MKLLWNILAGVLALVALALLVRHDYDKAFVTAAAGAVCWFLSYRVQVSAIVKANEAAENLDEQLESDEDDIS